MRILIIKRLTQSHGKLLNRRKNVFLSVDGFSSGLGCVNSWGAIPRDEYLLHYKSYKFNYWISPMKISMILIAFNLINFLIV